MFPHEHKTAFVLDHSPFFATSCGEPADIDVAKGSKTALCKSLWTCAVEAALEYYRIVTDVFPSDRLIRFFVSDSVGRAITEEWSEECMTLEKVMASLANVGAPDAKADQTNFNILNGITMAVEALTLCSPWQKELMECGVEVENRGRIVVVTHLKQLEEVKMIEDRVDELITEQNKLAKNLQDQFFPLAHIELCIINTFPVQSDETKLPGSSALAKVSELLSSEFHSCRSGINLASKAHALVQRHYDLASTTVTGIPMKEEQNSGGTSANYDVELLHHKSAHEELENTGLATDNGLLMKRDAYSTYTLKWCTPAAKSGAAEQIYATRAGCRCSPVEVNSRPSACLTSFLLAGRTVMLELPKKLASTKVTSHMLTCHGGHIYIHGLSLGRSPLDDPPSISEGCGGKVTDYRIPQFAEFMKECMLRPPDVPTATVERVKQQMQRITVFWPLTTNESALFSMSRHFEPLLTLMKKRQLQSDDVSECKKVIFHFLTMEKTNDPLTLASQCSKLKNVKREDYYRIVWNELEQFIRNYSHYSQNHHAVLNCLLQTNGRTIELFTKLKEPDVETSSATSGTKRFIDARSGFCRDNPESPSGSDLKRARIDQSMDDDSLDTVNLLTLVTKQYEEKTASWKDFHARANSSTPGKVDLYPDLMKKLDEDSKKGSSSTPSEKGLTK